MFDFLKKMFSKKEEKPTNQEQEQPIEQEEEQALRKLKEISNQKKIAKEENERKKIEYFIRELNKKLSSLTDSDIKAGRIEINVSNFSNEELIALKYKFLDKKGIYFAFKYGVPFTKPTRPFLSIYPLSGVCESCIIYL